MACAMIYVLCDPDSGEAEHRAKMSLAHMGHAPTYTGKKGTA
jgi:hypothetical protein